MKRRCHSILTVGTFVTDKADARQTGIDAVAVGEGLVRAWGHSFMFPHPEFFVLVSDPTDVFKIGDNMVNCKAQNITVFSSVGQLVMVDVTGSKGFYEKSLNYFFGVPLLWWSAESLPLCMILGRWWRHIQPNIAGTSVAWPQSGWSWTFQRLQY